MYVIKYHYGVRFGRDYRLSIEEDRLDPNRPSAGTDRKVPRQTVKPMTEVEPPSETSSVRVLY